jgi:hypothetical protein
MLQIRTAFHDAGAYNGRYGGADGSAMLSDTEQDWDANNFPLSFIPYARAALEGVVEQYQISWADAIAVGMQSHFSLVVLNTTTMPYHICYASNENHAHQFNLLDHCPQAALPARSSLAPLVAGGSASGGATAMSPIRRCCRTVTLSTATLPITGAWSE